MQRGMQFLVLVAAFLATLFAFGGSVADAGSKKRLLREAFITVDIVNETDQVEDILGKFKVRRFDRRTQKYKRVPFRLGPGEKATFDLTKTNRKGVRKGNRFKKWAELVADLRFGDRERRVKYSETITEGGDRHVVFRILPGDFFPGGGGGGNPVSWENGITVCNTAPFAMTGFEVPGSGVRPFDQPVPVGSHGVINPSFLPNGLVVPVNVYFNNGTMMTFASNEGQSVNGGLGRVLYVDGSRLVDDGSGGNGQLPNAVILYNQTTTDTFSTAQLNSTTYTFNEVIDPGEAGTIVPQFGAFTLFLTTAGGVDYTFTGNFQGSPLEFYVTDAGKKPTPFTGKFVGSGTIN